jgi:hypothetical protein
MATLTSPQLSRPAQVTGMPRERISILMMDALETVLSTFQPVIVRARLAYQSSENV